MGKEEKELVLNSLSKKKNQRKWGVGVESWSFFFLLLFVVHASIAVFMIYVLVPQLAVILY